MITFVATRFSKDGEQYAERFKAESWEQAHEFCKNKHWRLEGRYGFSFPAIGPNWIADVIISLMWFFSAGK